MELDSETLIVLVEQRPPLYDTSVKEHSDRNIVKKLWQEIAVEMNSTSSDCKNKWTSLRNSYARCLREERNTPPGSKRKRKRGWYLAQTMHFMKNKMNPRETRNSIDSQEENSEHKPFSIAYDKDPLHFQSSVHPSTSNDSFDSDRHVENYKIEKKIPNIPAASQKKIVDPAIYYLPTKNISSPNSEDPDLNFFKSLLPDYKKISSKNQRAFKEIMLRTLNRFADEEENI